MAKAAASRHNKMATNFFTTAFFPIMKEHFGIHIAFVIHGIICLAYFMFVKFRMPETKGRSWKKQRSNW
jgi:hypothetical protein